MKLVSHRYGKSRIRLCKVFRGEAGHEVKEITFHVSLEGDFAQSFVAADNSAVVPTDTMKNVVQALAHEHLGHEVEPFLFFTARHFLNRYPQVAKTVIQAEAVPWTRLTMDGTAHPHCFQPGTGVPTLARLEMDRTTSQLTSGVHNHVLMKTTGSGFAGFATCEHTTLPPTEDRILATRLEAEWTWHATPASYAASSEAIITAMTRQFALAYSPSVQATLHDMGQTALTTCPEISRITLRLPNLHYLRVNLSPFGIENEQTLFQPSEEPHGLIEATLARD